MVGDIGMDSSRRIDVGCLSIRIDSSNGIDVGFSSIRIDTSTGIYEWMGDSLVGMGQ